MPLPWLPGFPGPWKGFVRAIPKDLRVLCHTSAGLQGPQDLETGTQGVGMISRSHGVPQSYKADWSCVVPTASQVRARSLLQGSPAPDSDKEASIFQSAARHGGARL